MRILLIDNYDSFTFNLYQMLMVTGAEVFVRLNDQVAREDLDAADALVISPGPGNPDEAGQCLDVIREYYDKLPMLGVCLGHQCMGQAFGARIVRAPRLMHGKTSPVLHDGMALYRGLPSPFTAGRYHSLVISNDTLPPEFVVSAKTESDEIMGIRHRTFPIEGVQFHPESILTDHGQTLLRNFVEDRIAQVLA